MGPLVGLVWGGRAGSHWGCGAAHGLILARLPKANSYHLDWHSGNVLAYILIEMLRHVGRGDVAPGIRTQ